jgi:mycothiol synthase
MSPVTVRRTTRADAAGLAEVCNALAQALHGEADVSVEFIRSWFDFPTLEFWGAELDGRLVGHLDVRHKREARIFEADIRVHPDAAGQGVADALAATVEAWAREHGAPGDTVHVFPEQRESELVSTAQAHGYRLVRHFYEMRIELDGVREEPTWPDGILSAPFVAGRDQERVHAAQMEAFAGHFGFDYTPFDEWRSWAVESSLADPTLWKLVLDDGELAGLAINSWHGSGDLAFGWVNVLGVRERWRRRGLGEALLRSSFAEFARRGATRVGLGVDAENPTGAVRLYEKAGMYVARRQDIYELKL